MVNKLHTKSVGFHFYSSADMALGKPEKLTNRVFDHAGILYPQKCVRGHINPLTHTGYIYSIPVAFTSNIAIDFSDGIS